MIVVWKLILSYFNYYNLFFVVITIILAINSLFNIVLFMCIYYHHMHVL